MEDPGATLTSDFLVRLVHDARAQLRTVVATAQMMQQREHSAAELQEAILKIVETGKELDRLLTGSVYFGTLAESPQTLIRPVVLSTLLKGLVLEQRPAIDEIGGVLCVGEPPAGNVPAGLQWILRELVKNALRFANAKPLQIQIELASAAGLLTVLVVDNGVGIPRKFADQVFKPFHRLHASDSVAGCGLGLATARRIANVCGGTIEILPAESGTTVKVSWPLIESSG
jgi:signal transduction histidine kinase